MLLSYFAILIASHIVAILLRMAGFRHYVLAAFLLFLAACVGFTLWTNWKLEHEPPRIDPGANRYDNGT